MLEFLVVNQEITRRDDRIVVADSINYLVANFMFASSEWTGEKTAIFKNDSVGTAYSVLLTNNSCIVPWEIIKTGTLSVSVFCSTLVTANECEILVEPSGYVGGQTPQPPTQDIYNQIIELLESNVTPEALETALEDYYTKTAMDLIIEDYSTTEEINTLLGSYTTFEALQSALADYLTEEQINTLLESYTTTTSLTTILADYLTEEQINTLLSDYLLVENAFSGSYNDLSDKPTLFSGDYDDLTDKPTLFSGSYTDLTNKPTIPTTTDQISETLTKRYVPVAPSSPTTKFLNGNAEFTELTIPDVPIYEASVDFAIADSTLSLAKRDKIQNKVRDYMFKSMFTQWNTAYLNDVIKQQVFPTYTKVTSTSTSNKQAFCGQTLTNGHTYYFMINSKTNAGTTVKAKISLSASPFTEYAYVTLPISASFSNRGFLYTNNTGEDRSCQLSIQEPASNSLDIDLAYCVLLDITGTDLMNLTWQEITDNYVNNVDLFKDNYLYFDIPTKLDELYDYSALTLWNRKNTLRYNRNFLRVSSTNIVDANGIRFLMRGINEGNDCTTINSSAGSDMIATTNGYPESHNEDSYRELRDLGFNCLRFQFAYTFFEGAENPVIDPTYQGLPSQYQAKAWEWLDREVALARKYNIKLLFNMHVCPGMGGWEIATADMWTTANSRIRLVNMWKAIARRYANEDIVLGYGLINEPVITFQTDNATTIGVYQTLINTLCTEIRKVDTNHILVVENALRASNGTTALNSNNNFVDVLNNGVTDTNYLYEAHIYHNMAITHEMSASKHPSINYPNEFAAWNYGSQYDWVANASQFISIPVGTADQTEWTDYYTPITTPNALCKIIYPWIRVRDANGGEILQMCDYGIDLYDTNDVFVETIFSDNAQFGAIFNGGALGTMTNPQLPGATTTGYMQLVANALSGYTTTSSMSDVPVSTRYRIPTGYKYRIRAKYRVSNIPSSGVAFRFYIGCDEINTANYTDTEERFKYNLNLYKGSADAKNIPLHVGEFGSNYASFLTLPRGGELWVRDALKVLRELQIDYSFFSYCGSLFSMYTNVNRDDAKQTILYDVIIQHFNEMTIEEIDAIIDNL